MRKAFFISDVHLGVESQQRERLKTEKLDKFFNTVEKEGEQLFILGDFFDFWFDYRSVIFADYFQVLCKLKRVAESGTKIHIFGGNHDWWFSKKGFFSKKLNAEIYNNPAVVEIFGKKFFLAHGDGIAPSDRGYRWLLKPILRNPISIWLFGLLPAELGRILARITSSGSKLYTEKRNLSFEREYEEFAHEKLRQDTDFVIMGHLHIPTVIKFEEGTYINSGDFYKNFSYVEFDGYELMLKKIE